MYFSEPFTRRQARWDLILIANHKDWYFYVRGNKIEVKRGQVARGERDLSLRWQWSRDKVRGFLLQLESSKQIIQQKNRLCSIYTIVNYDKYQTTEPTTDPTTEKPQKNQNKKDNNIKNIKETIDAPPSVDLENLWNVFPHARKAKKAETLKYLAKLDYDSVAYALKILKREVWSWVQDSKYIPAMERWARDFVKLDKVVEDKKLLEIYKVIRTWENTKETIAKFAEDFGRDKVLELYAIIDAENKKLLLSWLK